MLHQANTTESCGIPLRDDSVDKVVVAPPWNRQFGIHGNIVDFYRRMLQEIFRVVRPSGRVVLFVSRSILPKLKTALQHSDKAWQLSAERSFALTRATTGVILVLQRKRQDPQATALPAKFLSWEGQAPESGRDLYEYWRSLRAKGLPRLEAVSISQDSTERAQSQSGKGKATLRAVLICLLGLGFVLVLRSRS